ncbi:zincin-like metallopeptidase toxin domain-containing protein, partial [Tenacibaculum maritimum]|uniref:zincin-like metallopeptidase toxin domain-containing protein n=1 Tax=Tenacibaculum maritimum TaxID=107401 RepID=UPI003875BF16
MNKTVFIPYLVIFNIVIISPKQYFPLFFYVSELQIHQIIQRYNYHPFSPTVLLNSKNPTFLLKDKDQKEGIRFTKLPAFLLYANNQKAFWENVLTGVEYSVDILTTVSGVGNLIKAGRLVKLLKNGKTLLYKTKQVTTAIATTKAIAGVIEVSSGTVNALLKLTSIDDTKLGISISKYLFYLEMIALTGEVSVFLKGKLQQSAKEIVENPKFTKSLDKLVKKGESNEIIEYLDGVAEVVSIGRGRYLGQSLRALDFDFIRKFLIKNKVDLQIGKTKGTFEVEGYFYKSGNIMKMDYENAALFITDGKNMKLVLRENATVYELLHELMHFRHSKELGIKNYYNMLQAEGVLKTERYVFDKIVSNFKYLNKNELNHAERYINYYYKKLGVTDDLGSPIKIVLPFDINSIPK